MTAASALLAAASLSFAAGGIFLLAIAVLAVMVVAHLSQRRHFWRGHEPHRTPLVHLDARMGVRPTILGHAVPPGYRLACLYFGTGLIDRTQTLDQGFPYRVLDPIPPRAQAVPSIEMLVAEQAQAIVHRAREQNCQIRLLWSGGIDSTAAACALLTALADDRDRLEICYSSASRKEYPDFFDTVVKRHRRRRMRKVSDMLDPAYLVVTGECGDQLFGSVKVTGQPIARLRRPWQSELPALLAESFASPQRADAVLRYLEPQIARAPVPLPDLYELMWWLNFSLKWQAVTLRMSVSTGPDRYPTLADAVVHFYQTPGFQRWALVNPNRRIGGTWQSHKWPLKDIILAFTGDRRYYDTKVKVPSLGGMLRVPFRRAAIACDASGMLLAQPLDRALRRRNRVSIDVESGPGWSFNARRENPLWDAVDGSGE